MAGCTTHNNEGAGKMIMDYTTQNAFRTILTLRIRELAN